MWVILVICSAFFLGIYDVFKKLSLSHNAVLVVMLFSSLTSLLLFVPSIIISYVSPETLEGSFFFVPFSGWNDQILICVKSIVVLSSWICTFFALKHLPISIASPVRATGPMWTLLGAILLLGETLNTLQWLGIAIIFICLYAYSVIGKKEGIHFRNNIWILLIFAGTLLGAISGLYDKYLITERGIDKMELQAWFSIYQFLLMLPLVGIIWFPNRHKTDSFTWRWSIPLIGIFLVLADLCYFYALSLPGAMISVVSIIRRSGVIISFISGVLIFKEKNTKTKGYFLIGVLAGVYILYLAK